LQTVFELETSTATIKMSETTSKSSKRHKKTKSKTSASIKDEEIIMISDEKIKMIPIQDNTTEKVWINMLPSNATDEPQTKLSLIGMTKR
jgi:hypothetical protein